MANKVQSSNYDAVYDYFKQFDGCKGKLYKTWCIELMFELDRASAECVMKKLLPDGSEEVEIEKLVGCFIQQVKGLSPGNLPETSIYKTKVAPEGIKVIAEAAVDMFKNYFDAFSRAQKGNKKNHVNQSEFTQMLKTLNITHLNVQQIHDIFLFVQGEGKPGIINKVQFVGAFKAILLEDQAGKNEEVAMDTQDENLNSFRNYMTENKLETIFELF